MNWKGRNQGVLWLEGWNNAVSWAQPKTSILLFLSIVWCIRKLHRVEKKLEACFGLCPRDSFLFSKSRKLPIQNFHHQRPTHLLPRSPSTYLIKAKPKITRRYFPATATISGFTFYDSTCLTLWTRDRIFSG